MGYYTISGYEILHPYDVIIARDGMINPLPSQVVSVAEYGQTAETGLTLKIVYEIGKVLESINILISPGNDYLMKWQRRGFEDL